MANRVVLEITDRAINLMVGNKKAIRVCKTISIQSGWVVNGRIINYNAIVKLINNFLLEYRINSKRLYIVIDEQEIITRFADLPIDEKSLKKNVEWEFKQYIPDVDKNYYMDYEVLEKCNEEDLNCYRVLMVAVPKAKIDQMVKLADLLKLDLVAIDTMTNSVARVIKTISHMNDIEVLGVLNIGFTYATLCILERGILKIQRQLPFGVFNILKEISDKDNVDLKSLEENYGDRIGEKSIQELYEEYGTISYVMDGFLNNLSKVIQFYNTGKVKKGFDTILIVKEEELCLGFDEAVEKYFGCKCTFMEDTKDLGIDILCSQPFKFDKFIPLYGALVRRG